MPAQEGNHHPTIVPMGCFRTADGYMNVGGASGRLLRNFCAVIELPDLPKDTALRLHREAIGEPRRRSTRSSPSGSPPAPRATGSRRSRPSASPRGRCTASTKRSPTHRSQHLGVVTEVDGSALGRIALVRNPVTSTRDITTVRTATPAAGQHTDEVLQELGLSTTDIDALRARGVI